MQRKGEYAHIILEYLRRSIALMDIKVDDRRALHAPLLEQFQNRDGNVIEHTETGAFGAEGMMCAAGERASPSFVEGILRGSQRSAYRAERPLDQPLRPWEADA